MAKDVTSSGMHVEFRDVTLWMGLEVTSVKITAPGAAMAMKPFSFDLPEQADLTVTVEEPGINALLRKNSPEQVRECVATIHDGRLHVRAVVKIGFKIPFEAEAALEIEDNQRLVVKLLSAGNLKGPAKELVAQLVEKANPLLEVSDWPMDVSFSTVECHAGQVILRGKIRSFVKPVAHV